MNQLFRFPLPLSNDPQLALHLCYYLAFISDILLYPRPNMILGLMFSVQTGHPRVNSVALTTY